MDTFFSIIIGVFIGLIIVLSYLTYIVAERKDKYFRLFLKLTVMVSQIGMFVTCLYLLYKGSYVVIPLGIVLMCISVYLNIKYNQECQFIIQAILIIFLFCSILILGLNKYKNVKAEYDQKCIEEIEKILE